MACRRAVSVLAPLLALTASGATELPAFNLAAGRTNPLKGLMAYSPDKDADTTLDCVPNTLEFMYVGVHHLMSSLTDFDFEHLEELLDSTASRHKHAVVRFIFDFPGEPDEYEVPAFLRTGDGAVELFDYAPVPEATCVADGSDTNQNCEVQADGNGCVDPSGCTFTAKTDEGFKAGRTPDYSNARLIEAMEAFVAEIGRVYDGDHRIAAFQVGLLGFWGEWHTHPHVAPDGCACGGIAPNGNPRIWIPQETKTRIAAAFTTAFSETQLELRYPYDLTPLPSELRNKFGFHDDSYAFNTLSEESDEGWFFWPQAVTHSATNNWKENMMGGETRPDIQPIVFSKDFAAGWPNGEWGQQDFNLCTETTHATYILNQEAFNTGKGYSDDEDDSGSSDLERALAAHAKLGYAFVVSDITYTASSGSPATTSVSVTVTQKGVAPFYYPLSLTLSCAGVDTSILPGVEAIIEADDSASFDFTLSATSECLAAVTVGLQSDWAYEEAPVVFAQGCDGSVVVDLSAALSGSGSLAMAASLTDDCDYEVKSCEPPESDEMDKASAAVRCSLQLSWVMALAAVAAAGLWR